MTDDRIREIGFGAQATPEEDAALVGVGFPPELLQPLSGECGFSGRSIPLECFFKRWDREAVPIIVEGLS